MTLRTYLYRSDCIEGRIFDTEDEVRQAMAAGWVDAPGKCAENKIRLDDRVDAAEFAVNELPAHPEVAAAVNAPESAKPRQKRGRPPKPNGTP
jgi:hypothetical protein